MIRYSSSVHKSDWECSSKSARGSLFVNPLYIKNLTNLTNLTTLQTLQPYRFLCRVPKGPHAYLCTLHKGGPPAPCSAHNLCSLQENRGSRGAAGSPFRTCFAAFRRGCNLAGFAHARTHGCSFSSLLRAFRRGCITPIFFVLESNWEIFRNVEDPRQACTVQSQSEMMAWNRVNRQK